MAISINDLHRTQPVAAPRILIYGPEKAGKTTLANEFPDPVFIQTEDGSGMLQLSTFGLLTTYRDVRDAIDTLCNEDHNFKTVVVDSVTALQALIYAEVCERGDENGAKRNRIEDFGYGKGYKYAINVWQEFIEGLDVLRRARGMATIMIAHSEIDRFDDPETSSYSRYDIDLHERARDLLKREVDAILLLKPDVSIKTEDQGFNKTRARADGGRNVWIHATSRPAYVAGNRYGIADKILYKPGEGFTALARHFPNTVTTENAEAV